MSSAETGRRVHAARRRSGLAAVKAVTSSVLVFSITATTAETRAMVAVWVFE